MAVALKSILTFYLPQDFNRSRCKRRLCLLHFSKRLSTTDRDFTCACSDFKCKRPAAIDSIKDTKRHTASFN
jgi:hypothetical protein